MLSDAKLTGERLRILVMPEDLLGPELGETFLDRHSLLVRTAIDTAQALATAELWRPHLVVFRADPDAEAAFRFCHTLKTTIREPVPKLLILTDQVTSKLHDMADAPCDGHLISPVAAEQLLGTIAELMDIQRRNCERVPLDVLVHTEGFAEEGAAVDSTLSNALTMSEESMLLEASRQLGLGARGRLLFFLPESSERLTLEAEVRVAVDEIRLFYVLEFMNLAPQHRAVIRRYIESRTEAA